MEKTYTSEILATLLTSSQCKYPVAEATAPVKLSTFLMQLEEKLLQLFDHIKGIDRSRINEKASELTLRPRYLWDDPEQDD
jgi:hypothetical protein